MQSFFCHCSERKKPIAERNWVVIKYKCNHSAFNGYHYTPSDYSTIMCNSCQAVGRTKAAYVEQLKHNLNTWNGEPLKNREHMN